MQHHVDGFISWSQHWLQDIFVSHATKALKSLFFFLHILEAQLKCFIVYAFFLSGDYPIRPLLYANKGTIALSIRLHPHAWTYSNSCSAALRNPAPGTVMAHRVRVGLHLWHTAQHPGEENQDWNCDENMGLWDSDTESSQNEDCKGSVWGLQGLVDGLHGGRGV